MPFSMAKIASVGSKMAGKFGDDKGKAAGQESDSDNGLRKSVEDLAKKARKRFSGKGDV
jgi:hypothetical protein